MFAAALVLLSAVAPAATATAAIDADSVGDLTATTAPATLDASAAAESTTTATAGDDTVASSDVVVFRLDASGEVDADGDGTLLGDELAFSLVETDDSAGDDDPKTLVTEGNATAVNTTENAVFVAVDLADATFERAGEETTAAANESYTATTTLTTEGEEVSRETTVSVVEPTVSFVDDPTATTAGKLVEFDVNTTLAPGTSLLFELTAEGAEAGTSSQATVGADGTATVPLSFFTFDEGEGYTITVSAEGTTAVNQSWSGETVAPQTATETETTTETSTTTATDGGDGAESTETSTDAPGFGLVAAVLALAGAALLAGRRD